MYQRMVSLSVFTLVLFMPLLCSAMAKERCSVRLKSMSAKTPGSLTFGSEGKLYLVYREETGKRSSAAWIYAFDGENCRELQKARIAKASTCIPPQPSRAAST